MDFEAIKQALITMAKAMVGVMDRLDKLIEVNEEILKELKKNNN